MDKKQMKRKRIKNSRMFSRVIAIMLSVVLAVTSVDFGFVAKKAKAAETIEVSSLKPGDIIEVGTILKSTYAYLRFANASNAFNGASYCHTVELMATMPGQATPTHTVLNSYTSSGGTTIKTTKYWTFWKVQSLQNNTGYSQDYYCFLPVTTDTSVTGSVEYTINFDLNGGKASDGSNSIRSKRTESKRLSVLPDNLTMDGYDFLGWYDAKTDGNKVTTSTSFSKDTTVYAHWKKQHTHSWAYAAEDNNIYAYCTTTDSQCEYYFDGSSYDKAITLTLNASDSVYTGSTYSSMNLAGGGQSLKISQAIQ